MTVARFCVKIVQKMQMMGTDDVNVSNDTLTQDEEPTGNDDTAVTEE